MNFNLIFSSIGRAIGSAIGSAIGWDFDLKKCRLNPLMSVDNLRRCSNCKCTLAVADYFEKNRKGELYKTCNTCRCKFREYDKTFREKHYMEYRVCDKCGNRYSVNHGLSNHQRTWLCAKSELSRESTLDDFYKWILDNKDNLLYMYKQKVPCAEAYFMKLEDKQ